MQEIFLAAPEIEQLLPILIGVKDDIILAPATRKSIIVFEHPLITSKAIRIWKTFYSTSKRLFKHVDPIRVVNFVYRDAIGHIILHTIPHMALQSSFPR